MQFAYRCAASKERHPKSRPFFVRKSKRDQPGRLDFAPRFDLQSQRRVGLDTLETWQRRT